MTEIELVNTLFDEAIGFYNIPLASFFVCEIIEVLRILEKAKSRIEFEHRLQYVAIQNALGKAFSKGYKYIDMFEKESNKKEVTQEEKEDLKAYLEKW